MVEKYNVLGIDVGASLSKTGLIEKGWSISYKDFSNKIWAHDGESNPVDYELDMSKEENVLYLGIKFGEGDNGLFPKEVNKLINSIEHDRWVLGKLAEDMSSVHQTLASDTLKVLQEEFYLNILGIIYSSVVDKGIDSENLVLGVLVPPRDYFNDLKDVLFKVLSRDITIKNFITGKEITVKLKEENIVVKPESIVSFIASFVDEDSEFTDAGLRYGELLNVSVDMGHSTTDLAIMENFKPKKNSPKTLDVATSQLLLYLGEELQRKFEGYMPPEEELVNAFLTGKMRLGLREEWIGEELSMVNKRFALELYENVYKYLTSHGLRLQQVAAFMFSGGGSVEVKNVKSVRSYFMDEVNKVSRYTESFTPEQYLKLEGHENGDKLDVVRYSNIIGFVRGLVGEKSMREE